MPLFAVRCVVSETSGVSADNPRLSSLTDPDFITDTRFLHDALRCLLYRFGNARIIPHGAFGSVEYISVLRTAVCRSLPSGVSFLKRRAFLPIIPG